MKTTKTSHIYDEILLQSMYYCPYGKENYNCFFKYLQKKSTSEKTTWYKSLTLKDKYDLMQCHSKCNCQPTTNAMKLTYFQNN